MSIEILFLQSRSRITDRENGLVVQLVRIHACHAWGRGFESRPDRQKKKPHRNVRLFNLLKFWGFMGPRKGSRGSRTKVGG